MDIADWRRRIDELDHRIVELISERAHAALEIGKLKHSTSLPVYEPSRERVIFENVRAANPGPLPDIELIHIYERIVDVMRSLQKNELASGGAQQPDSGSRKPGREIANKVEETGKES
jgi:chorismate mutase